MWKTLSRKGFTMIELLVVIAVIGILAVALLATLNPLEQIRKGRDTRTRSDISQMVSALERYNASLGYFPWQSGEGEDLVTGGADVPFVQINGGGSVTGCSLSDCTVEAILAQLTLTNEVKSSFVDRIVSTAAADVYLYFNDEDTGASAIGCFTPESNTFAREAFDRCKANSSWGTVFSAFAYNTSVEVRPCPDSNAATYATATFDPEDADEMICLP